MAPRKKAPPRSQPLLVPAGGAAPDLDITAKGQRELRRLLGQAVQEEKRHRAAREEALRTASENRGQIYSLCGELAALGNCADRMRFLRGGGRQSAETSGSEGETQDSVCWRADLSALRRDSVEACRLCEQQRQIADSAQGEADALRRRAGFLEEEIETALQRRASEEAARESLDAESAILSARGLRLEAAITALQANIEHARKELARCGGGTDSEQRRLEAELSVDADNRRQEVRSDLASLRRSEGEKRLLESVGERLRVAFVERTQQVEALRERLEAEAEECEALRSTARELEVRLEEARAKTAEGGAPVMAATSSGAHARQSAADELATNSKRKRSGGKAGGGKDHLTRKSGQVEDLELEVARVVAVTEAADKRGEEACKAADQAVKEGEQLLAKRMAERQALAAQLAQVRKDKIQVLAENQAFEAATREQEERVEKLQATLRAAEREKIIMGIEVKRKRDALQEAMDAL